MTSPIPIGKWERTLEVSPYVPTGFSVFPDQSVDWSTITTLHTISLDVNPLLPARLPDPREPSRDDAATPGARGNSPGDGTPGPDPSSGAGGSPPPPDFCNTCTRDVCQVTQLGSPVVAMTGELVVRYTDLEVPARGIPFRFQRFFSSFNDHRGPMGPNWTHSFSWPLRESARPDGTVLVSILTEYGTTAWFVKPYFSSTFVPGTTSATNLELAFTAAGGYRLTRRFPDARPLEYHYDPTRRLVRVHRDPDYDLQLTYDASPPAEWPKVILDTEGRSYVFQYTPAGDGRHALERLTELRSGRTLRYGYTPGDPLLERVLDSAAPPSPLATDRLYFYGSDEGTGASRRGRLTKIVSRGGAVLMTAAYDPDTGRVIGLAENGIHYRLEYDPAASRYIKTGSDGTVAITTYGGPNGTLVACQDPSGAVSRREFGPDGALVAARDGNGNRTTYLQSGNSISITDPEGNTRQLDFIPGGPITREVDALGRQTVATYDPRHRLTSLTEPGGFVWTLGYDDLFDRLLSLVTPLGHGYTHVLDTRGNVVRAALPDDATFHLTFTSDDRPTSITDPMGHTVRLETDSAGRLLVLTDADLGTTLLTHDVEGRLASVTDPLGRMTRLEYDGFSRLARLIGPDGWTVRSSQYLDELHTRTETDAAGNQTLWQYNPRTRVRSVLLADSTTAAVAYNPEGHVVRWVDGRGHVTILGYDRALRLTSIQQPDGLVTRFVLDAAGQRLQTIEAEGTPRQRTTTCEYDPRGLLSRLTRPDGTYARFVHDGEGNRTLMAAPGPEGPEAVTLYGRDSRGRLTSVQTPDGSVLRLVYDAASRILSGSTAHGTTQARTTDFTHSPGGRLLTVRAPDGSVTAYEHDAAGQVTARTVASNHPGAAVRTEYSWDLYGRVTEVREAAGTPEARSISFGYNRNGNVVRLTNGAGATWRFGYDSRNRLICQTDPLGRETRTFYDGNGNATETVLPGGEKLVREYDKMDRPVRVICLRADGSVENTVVTTYDDFGNPTAVSDGSGLVTREFDVGDRVLMLSQSQTGDTLRARYDPAGNLAALSLDRLACTTVSYTWDLMHRLRALEAGGAGRVDLAYNLHGQRASAVLGNGVRVAYTYESAGRLSTVEYRNPGGVVLSRFGLSYDSRGNVTGLEDAAGETVAVVDALDRLVEVTYADGGRERFEYDAADNRSLRLVRIDRTGGPTVSLDYTLNGQLSRAQAGSTTPATWTWNVAGQLVGVSREDGTTAAFGYLPPEAGGLLWRTRETGGVERRVVWDLRGNPLAELDARGQLTRLYLGGVGLDEMFGQCDAVEPGMVTTRWLLTDSLGSVRAMADATGALLAEQAFGVFGQVRGPPIPAELTRLGYTGRSGVANPGMLYLRNRWYAPGLGRFLSEDPIGFRGGWNLQGYVANNPLRYTDPTGLEERQLEFGGGELGSELGGSPGGTGARGGRGGMGPVESGRAAVDAAIRALQRAGNRVISGREITLDTAGGRIRPDLLIRTPQGTRCFVEVKRLGAPFTPNQMTGYPALESTGATPQGANAAGVRLTPGVPIPGIPVIIILVP
ncbi:MAG: hypothetical protein HY816_15535 [Candidatus Wallbacteria bacterium]|nr:hypothetical protein [Candidatus Wallbacteria bacterium]